MGTLTFTALAVPYVVLAIALAFLAGLVLVIRGDSILRLALLVCCAAGLPWALCFMLVGCTTDHQLATHIYRVGYGLPSLVGPALMMLILGVSGRFDGHRALVGLAFAVGLTSSILCWSTNWVVKGVHETPSGLLYITPGWYQLLHIGQIPLWGGIGMLVSRRGMRTHTRDTRWRGQRRRILWVIGLVVVTLWDSLLAHEIAGYYPIAWIALLAAIAVASYSILAEDLFKGRGVDRAALIEVGVMALVFGFLLVVTFAGNRPWLGRPLVTAVFLAPLPTLGLVAAWILRIRARRAERSDDPAAITIDRFAEEVRDLEDEPAVARRLADVLRAHVPIQRLRVWSFDEQGRPRALLGEEPGARIDSRVRAWLVANLEPLVTAELTSARLGGLRVLIEDAVGRFDADVILPLVDRDTLVGVAAGELPPYRVLRDEERDFVRAATATAARGLTFLALTREADHLASTQREVELAEAVAQARAVGDVVVPAGPWQVLGNYRPAARVAGDVWSCTEVGEGRVLLFIGDVVGRGVPSALVSAAVGGVCDAAPSLTHGVIEPRGLLELIHKTVRDLGGGRQRVTGFAAILDRGAGTIRWACAGHRGAYLVHPAPPDSEDERARLELLGARSSPLGEPVLVVAEGEKPLGGGDWVVAASDGVVEVRDPRGDPWGDRRLQRILRDQLFGAGDRAARMIVAAAVAHAGDAPIADDMLVVVARPSSIGR